MEALLNADALSYQIDEALSTWIKTEASKEQARLSQEGVKALLLPVKNCSIVIDRQTNPKKPFPINRIEIETGFQFDKVKQVSLSAEPVSTLGCSPLTGMASMN